MVIDTLPGGSAVRFRGPVALRPHLTMSLPFAGTEIQESVLDGNTLDAIQHETGSVRS